ncbi:MAG: efflux RND transporter periplasmic adaptor subunit [Desulfobulbaceae bacterium]|nr:MAG: efflux RND transporter periplasmic adaptor subunit [Desulfobulbaceae bacterium]
MKLKRSYHFSAILLILVLIAACDSDHSHRSATPAKVESIPVETVTVKKSAPLRQVEVMGNVQATDRAVIASRLSGNILEMHVQLGSRVAQGEQLVRISAGEIAAKVLQAKAQLEQAERNLTREQNLLKKNAATKETVKSLEEARTIAAATYKEAKTMLSYASIEAPFTGVITSKPSNVGDLATPGRPLLTLEGEDRLEIATSVPESLVLGLQIGDTLPVHIPAAGLRIDGVVIEIAPAADPHSRTAPVTLSIESEPRIRSGQFARVSLAGAVGEAILVPHNVVSRVGQLEQVFIVDKDRVKLQLVKTGLSFDQQIEILSGLSEGDLVAIPTSGRLADGQPVTVR